jgi:integrase
VASVSIRPRPTKSCPSRHVVEFRVGGRETPVKHGGSFPNKRLASIRAAWIHGELAAMRVPDVRLLAAEPTKSPTLREVAARWLESRIDVADQTRRQHRSDIGRALGALGDRPIDAITASDVAELVAELAKTRRRETVRKSVMALAMVFDFANVEPNPARDKRTVKLPREAKHEVKPPTVDQVLAVHELLPPRYRLPLIVLDATGMRLGELEGLTWGDVDEPRQRWRVSAAVSKTRQARWVNVPPAVFGAVTALCPRDDRIPERPVFQGFGGDRFRTAITRACTAAGVPTFSPHNLRHRRISLLHAGGVPWARIGEHVGQRNLAVTANTYTHVLPDERELDHAELLA